MEGGFDPDDRRTFDWSKAAPENQGIALMRTLISIRNKYPALRTGSYMTLTINDTQNIYAFGRMDRTNRIAVVLNNDSTSHQVNFPVHKLEIPDGTILKNEITNESIPVIDGQISVTIPGHYGAILVY
jgi:alpha-glucosidase